MKKLFRNIFVLTFTALMLVSSISSVAYAQDEKANWNEDYNLLDALGLLPEGFVDDFKPEKGMTRAAFATLCSSVLNLKEYDGVANISNPFTDVLESSRYYSDILEVYDFGLMQGDGSGKFRPDEKISYEAVAKVIVSALGYESLANVYGGYPSGYLRVASNCGILKGTNHDGKDYVTGANIIIMLANAVNTNTFEIESIANDTVIMGTDANKTLLSVYHGIFGYNDILNGFYGKQTKGIELIEKGSVMLGDKVYELETLASYEEFFGRNVDFYVNLNSEKIVAIIERDDNNKTETVLISDVTQYTDTKITYYDAKIGKDKSVSVSSDAIVVFNGRPCADFTKNDFISGDGKITFIDNNGDKVYDIVDLSKNINYVVKSASSVTESVYDMYNGKVLNLSKYDNVVFKDEFGTDMNLDELVEYDVLSVFESKDGLCMRIIYSNSEAEGMLSAVGTKGDYAVVDEVRYNVAENFKKEILTLPSLANGIFVLDSNGSIASYRSFDNSYQYGYLLEKGVTTSLDSSYKVKLLTTSGEFIILDVPKKLKLDGEVATPEALMATITKDGKIVQQPVKYLESSGYLRGLDTISAVTNHPGEDSLRYLYKGYDDNNSKLTSLKYISKQMIFGGKVALNSGSKIFVASATYSSDEENFVIQSASSLENEGDYCINAFTSDADSQVADIVVRYSSTKTIGSGSDFILVEQVSRALNEEGDSVYKITGLRAGSHVSYVVKENSLVDNLKSIHPENTANIHILESGDIIDAGVNSTTKEITSIYLYYEKCSGYARGATKIGESITTTNRIIRANVYSMDGDNMWLTQNALDYDDVVLGINDIESVNAGLYKIYVHSTESSKPEVRMGSMTDILDYKSSGSDFSTVVATSEKGSPGVIVVYR